MEKLKKGTMYVGILNGDISFGRYLGAAGGWMLFSSSPYASDSGRLSDGISAEQFGSWDFFPLSSEWAPSWPTESEAIARLSELLGD